MKRHDRNLFWARHDDKGKRWLLWTGDGDIPTGCTLHVLVPSKDYDVMRAAYFAARRKKAKVKRG